MSKKQNRCKQCGKPMNPIQWMMGKVCLECTKKNHKKVVKGSK